jgi:VCBS repeat protein/HYDIN/CFA65/VesB family protein/IPT/TIG domain-containing protein
MKPTLHVSLFLVRIGVVLIGASVFAANNPVPLINQPLRPSAVSPGSSGFTLTVTGANFVSGATVNWNGSPRTTAFVSWEKLTASITAADVAHAGTAVITVTNPGPSAPSNFVYFPIHPKFAAGAFARRDTVITGGVDSLPFVGDFNGDGKLDVATMAGSTIEVFLGNGDGTFQNPLSSNSSLQGAGLVALGDFNNDGKLDLIAEDFYGDDFTYLGNGDGTFNEVSTMWGDWPGFTVVADLNRDGNLDVINEGSEEGAAGTDTELGNGEGVFSPKWIGSINNQASGSCAVADFNHDGKLDIACPGGDFYGNGVEVAFGNGDGTFGTPTEYPAPAVGLVVLTGDVNGDGKLDLVTDGGWVLLGNGDGTFDTPSGPAFSPMFLPQLVDINADGKLDVVGSAYNLGALRGVNSTLVSLGNGDGTFQSPVAQEISWGNGGVGWGDFNGDGKLDAVTFVQDLITEKPIMSVLLQTNLGVSQTVISYGTFKVGTSSVQTSVLTNIGTTAITLSSIAFTSPAPSYAIGNACGSSLAPGASCTLTLTFTPQKTGALSAKIRISYSGTVGNPQYIEMIGEGN